MANQKLRDASFVASDSRSNFKQIIAKRSDLAKIDGGRMAKPGSGTTDHYAGEVLGQATSGADAGRWKPYVSTATDGSQVAKGILLEDCSVGSDDEGSEIVVLKGGCAVFYDLLIGIDSGAIASLFAKQSVEHGVNLLDLA